jgi:pimeloyl-ACP methyl ester carboxylesterase
MATLQTPEALLHYDDHGRGPVVLFLQGVGVGRCAWAAQTRELSSSFRCIAVDHRGIGGSDGDLADLSVDRMARDALALLDALGIERAHVVGHSLGGVVAQRLALLAPERSSSLALLCTFAGGADLARPSARLMWLGLRTRVGTRMMRRAAFARLVMPAALIDERGVDAVASELEAAFGRPLDEPPPIADRQLAALRAHDERARLVELATLRTFVGSGRLDPIATSACARRLAAAIPGATQREWADASHALPIQLAEEVNDALRDHFASATNGAG